MQKYNKKKITVFSLVVLIFLTIAFIWTNSLLPPTLSDDSSSEVLGLLTSLVNLIFGEGVLDHYALRKITHGIEFMALGVELSLLSLTLNKVSIKEIISALYQGLSIAFIDEGLQLLANRGSDILDVLIDFGGVAVGVIIVFAIYNICKKVKEKKVKAV